MIIQSSSPFIAGGTDFNRCRRPPQADACGGLFARPGHPPRRPDRHAGRPTATQGQPGGHAHPTTHRHPGGHTHPPPPPPRRTPAAGGHANQADTLTRHRHPTATPTGRPADLIATQADTPTRPQADTPPPPPPRPERPPQEWKGRSWATTNSRAIPSSFPPLLFFFGTPLTAPGPML